MQGLRHDSVGSTFKAVFEIRESGRWNPWGCDFAEGHVLKTWPFAGRLSSSCPTAGWGAICYHIRRLPLDLFPSMNLFRLRLVS